MKRYLLLILFAWLFGHGPQSHAQITFNSTYQNSVDNDFNILVETNGYAKVMLSYNPPYTQYIFQKLDFYQSTKVSPIQLPIVLWCLLHFVSFLSVRRLCMSIV